jgi:hypothetical protein
MLKSYLSVLWRRGALCYTTSLHRLIPPLMKRSRILVSDGVVILISVELYLWLLNVWLRVPYRKIPISRYPPIRAKVALRSQQYFCRSELPAFTFYGHLQNRLRPLPPKKKNCEHRPPHPFLAPAPPCILYSEVPGAPASYLLL